MYGMNGVLAFLIVTQSTDDIDFMDARVEKFMSSIPVNTCDCYTQDEHIIQFTKCIVFVLVGDFGKTDR